MRPLGASDKYFYYTSSFENTFAIRMKLDFKELDAQAFFAAANEALKRYPEFAYKPVIKDNKLWAKENTAPVVLSQKDGRDFRFASNDTNGYLFFFTYSGNTVNAHWYHGLTDFAGFMSFLRCVLAIYAEKTGFELTDDEKSALDGIIRKTAPKDPVTDPYGQFGDASCVPEYRFVNTTGAFAIPADYDYSLQCEHGYIITMPLAPYLKTTKQLGVSFAPLLANIIAESLTAVYDIENKPVVIMVPADFRRLADFDTAVNFSDGMLLPVEPDDRDLPIGERCGKTKEALIAQRTLNNFKSISGKKAAAVASFESEQAPLWEVARDKQKPPKPGAFRPVTSAMSYPGKITFTQGLDRMFEYVDLFAWIKGSYTIAHTYGDNITLHVYCRSDNGVWIGSIMKVLSDFGFDAKLEDEGLITAPKLDPSLLEIVE